MQRLIIFISTVLVLTSFKGVNDNKGDDVVGVWLTGKQTAHVEIFKTGKYYYGKIVWLKRPNDEAGNPRVDEHNPDAKLKSNPLMSLLLLKGFTYDDKHLWNDGTIYDPEEGKTYSCKMWFEKGDTDNLKMRGFVGVSLLGRTDTWTRVK